MKAFILPVVLLLLALGGVVVRKTYYALPLRELKRRAAKQDKAAVQLYRAVAYGNSLRSLLWLYIGLTSAASLVLLARLLPVWASLLIVGPILWIAFSFIPASRTTKLGSGLARLVTPLIAWLLNYLHPMLSRSADAVEKRYTAPDHTGLFEREDLMELIEKQQRQPDSRISDEELEIVKRALRFADHKISDIMTPRKRIKTVLADDTIGPVLIDEIHKSGQDHVLVRESPKGDFVGTLAFKQLDLKSSGKVRDIMSDTVYYLHEGDSLSQALHAFFATNRSIFVVVNNFEECAGVLTIETVIKQLLGHIPGDDFGQHTNIAAVAARHAKPKDSDKTDETPVKTDGEVVE